MAVNDPSVDAAEGRFETTKRPVDWIAASGLIETAQTLANVLSCASCSSRCRWRWCLALTPRLHFLHQGRQAGTEGGSLAPAVDPV